MTAIVNETVSVKKKPSGRRVIFASAFGNALEFFDFGVYNFFVVYISTLFFPPSADHNVALLLAFATFGVSFFMRPLGGIIVGAWADRFGRKWCPRGIFFSNRPAAFDDTPHVVASDQR